jgi:hypothetical protein
MNAETTAEKEAEEKKQLFIAFHGRIIDHLGVQMYQSPVASIAEIISNAWDADATKVEVTLPTDTITETSEIIIQDDGNGMTLDECQNRFLNIGYNRRDYESKTLSRIKRRPLMGRKGIGKFAGFGIAKEITVETISETTGEKTKFTLKLDEIRKGDTYVHTEQLALDVEEYLGKDLSRKTQHGTKITLKKLNTLRRPSIAVFNRGMARRFVINNRLDAFNVLINGEELPEAYELTNVDFAFPRDYTSEQKYVGLSIDSEGWGIEKLSNEREVKWKILFYKDTIKEESLQGISVFAHKKLAQTPFMFNLTGGLPSQAAPEYMTGMVIADYVDELGNDIIAPERQRLNWEHDELQPLLMWGQLKIKELLTIWKLTKQQQKIALLEEKTGIFYDRIEKFLPHEKEIIKKALLKLAGIPKISTDDFKSMGESIIKSWEGGRLKNLINEMSKAEDMDEEKLLKILLEAGTLTALHTAEAVKTKLEAIEGLRQRIEHKQLENAVRDYIAKNAWMISPKWETFVVERSIAHIIDESLQIAGINSQPDWSKRVDLILSSGESLLILEFMRPGLTIDYDHVSRFQLYINSIKSALDAQTAHKFKSGNITGFLVADKINKSNAALLQTLKQYAEHGMYTMEWKTLLAEAEAQWKDFFDVLIERSPKDDRIIALQRPTADVGSEAEAVVANI